MKTIPVEEIFDGMILAGDLNTPDGNVLLNDGMELSEGHRKLLAKRGITEINIIEKDADEESSTVGDPKIDEQIARVEHVFANVRGDELMDELFERAMSFAKRGVIGD